MAEVLGFLADGRGEYDYLLRSAGRVDMKRYDDFYKRLVRNSVPGLSDVHFGFAMEQIKYTALPVE